MGEGKYTRFVAPWKVCKTSIPGSNPGGASNPETSGPAGPLVRAITQRPRSVRTGAQWRSLRGSGCSCLGGSALLYSLGNVAYTPIVFRSLVNASTDLLPARSASPDAIAPARTAWRPET